MARTSRSSIVRRSGPVATNPRVPLVMARPSALSVVILSPDTSVVRSAISPWARVLKDTRDIAGPGIPDARSNRARSVSTRVLPEPAGAMIRAAIVGVITAMS